MKKILAILALSLFMSLYAQNIKVGIAANYPPFDFLKDDKITGFDYDLLEAIAKKADLKLEWVNMSFNALIPALKMGKVDMIASAMSNTPKRARSVDFSDTYFLTKNLYIKKSSNKDIKSLEDLAGKKLGVQLGSIQESRARKIKGAKIIANENIINSILALKAGKIDAVLADKDTALGYLEANKAELISFLQENDGSKGFAYAFDKDKQRALIANINKALEELKKDGTYKKIVLKYKLN